MHNHFQYKDIDPLLQSIFRNRFVDSIECSSVLLECSGCIASFQIRRDGEYRGDTGEKYQLLVLYHCNSGDCNVLRSIQKEKCENETFIEEDHSGVLVERDVAFAFEF